MRPTPPEGIWSHKPSTSPYSLEVVKGDNTCLFCGKSLKRFVHSPGNGAPVLTDVTDTYHYPFGGRCLSCGWWMLSYDVSVVSYQRTSTYGAYGTLLDLDGSIDELGTSEIRDYLTARYDARFSIDPRKFEEVVTAVYRDLGYDALHTGYHAGGGKRAAGDDGIDVILHDASGTRIGVQVKRVRNAVEVEQIRSLTGALVLKGMTRGIFVTTSRFQRGAQPCVDRYAAKGYEIELVEAQRFFDALNLSRTDLPPTREELKQWWCSMQQLEHTWEGERAQIAPEDRRCVGEDAFEWPESWFPE